MGGKISIIIATFNAGKYLQECLDSIIPQLNGNCALIIIDGGSKDDTVNIIEKNSEFIFYTISEPDQGIYDAWNKGIKASNNDWIMFVGADDRLTSNAIEDYINFIEGTKLNDYDIISSKRVMVDLKGNKISTVGALWQWPRCLSGMPISHPGALHNKSLFQEHGIFNIDYKIAGDFELLLRKGPNLKSAFIDVVTIEVCEGGVSDSYLAIKEYYKVLKNKKFISTATTYRLYLTMYIKYTIKKSFRLFNINIHS